MTRTKNCLLIGLLFKSVGTKLGAAAVATLVAMAVSLILTPGVAHAYQVHISITGGGQVTETTPANLVGSNCFSLGTTPTATVGKDCYAGTPNGDYGWNWDVIYVATPASGYSFVRWESDGSPAIPVDHGHVSPVRVHQWSHYLLLLN